MSAKPRQLRRVVRWEEEWRTKGNRRFPRGRACLWLILACGHCEQRLRQLNKDKTVTAPKSVKCWDCSQGRVAVDG